MGPIGSPETSVRNCQYSLRDNPEQRRPHVPQRNFEITQGNEAAVSTRTLFQYCQLPDKYSRDISRYICNCLWYFQI